MIYGPAPVPAPRVSSPGLYDCTYYSEYNNAFESLSETVIIDFINVSLQKGEWIAIAVVIYIL